MATNGLGIYGLAALGNTIGYGASQLGLAAQRKQDKSAAKESYDSNARVAYINYLKQQNAMNETMMNSGISGGASETARVNAANNYARNQAINDASKSQALTSIDNNYRDASLQNLGNYVTNMGSLVDKAVQQKFAQDQFDWNKQQAADALALEKENAYLSTLDANTELGFDNLRKQVNDDLASGKIDDATAEMRLRTISYNQRIRTRQLQDMYNEYKAADLPVPKWLLNQLGYKK